MIDIRDGEAVRRLARQAYQVWRNAKSEAPHVVVEPSIPILYFGDLEAYLRSPLRVATVGLNPSREEFPSEEPFQRFPAARELKGQPDERYLTALNEYYRTDPYRRWFSAFEPLLEGMDASYYPGKRSTALHTDLCTPVATDPTWSRLDRAVRQDLIRLGRPLWHDVVRFLRPHVLLISVARSHLAKIELPRLSESRTLYRVERTRPYEVESWEVELGDDEPALVAFGRAAQLPFGTVSKKERRMIGRRIREAIDA